MSGTRAYKAPPLIFARRKATQRVRELYLLEACAAHCCPRRVDTACYLVYAVYQCDFLKLQVLEPGEAAVVEAHEHFPAGCLRALPAGERHYNQSMPCYLWTARCRVTSIEFGSCLRCIRMDDSSHMTSAVLRVLIVFLVSPRSIFRCRRLLLGALVSATSTSARRDDDAG